MLLETIKVKMRKKYCNFYARNLSPEDWFIPNNIDPC